MATARTHARPEPKQSQIDEVRIFATELHHAFHNKPSVDSPKRPSWDRQFRKTTAQLIQVLQVAKFRRLPRVAMGAVWENNVAIVTAPQGKLVQPFNTEKVIPVYDNHEALNPSEALKKLGCRSLGMVPDDNGPFGLLSLSNINAPWWLEYMDDDQEQSATPATIATPVKGVVPPARRRGRSRTADRSPTPSERGDARGRPAGAVAGTPSSTRERSLALGKHRATGTLTPSPVPVQDEMDCEEKVAEADPQAPRQSKRVRKASSRALEIAANEASKGSLRGRSAAAKGKRKAEPEPTDSAAEPTSKRVRTDFDMPEETVPWRWDLHTHPCASCQMAQQPCHFCALVVSACRRCRMKRVKCSLTVSGPPAAAAYLAYVYSRRSFNIGAKGNLLPPKVPANFQVPAWFQTQYDSISKENRKLGPPPGNGLAVPTTPMAEFTPSPAPPPRVSNRAVPVVPSVAREMSPPPTWPLAKTPADARPSATTSFMSRRATVAMTTSHRAQTGPTATASTRPPRQATSAIRSPTASASPAPAELVPSRYATTPPPSTARPSTERVKEDLQNRPQTEYDDDAAEPLQHPTWSFQGPVYDPGEEPEDVGDMDVVGSSVLYVPSTIPGGQPIPVSSIFDGQEYHNTRRKLPDGSTTIPVPVYDKEARLDERVTEVDIRLDDIPFEAVTQMQKELEKRDLQLESKMLAMQMDLLLRLAEVQAQVKSVSPRIVENGRDMVKEGHALLTEIVNLSKTRPTDDCIMLELRQAQLRLREVERHLGFIYYHPGGAPGEWANTLGEAATIAPTVPTTDDEPQAGPPPPSRTSPPASIAPARASSMPADIARSTSDVSGTHSQRFTPASAELHTLSAPSVDMLPAIVELHSRVDHLERTFNDRVQLAVAQQLPRAVEEYLGGLGLGGAELRLLAEQVAILRESPVGARSEQASGPDAEFGEHAG